jgi:hypothetical protein
MLPITVAARSKTLTLFALSKAVIVGSNLIQGMDDCAYSVFGLFCGVGRCLAMG